MNKSVCICSLLVVLGMAYLCSSRPVDVQHHHSKRSTTPQPRITLLSRLLSLVRDSSDDSHWKVLQNETVGNQTTCEKGPVNETNRRFCELSFFCDFMGTYELMSAYTNQSQVAGFQASTLIGNMINATEHLCKLWVSISYCM